MGVNDNFTKCVAKYDATILHMEEVDARQIAACVGGPTADLRPGMLAELIRQNAEMRALLNKAHNLLHNLTAIIPFNDQEYKATTDAMSEIRALLNGEAP